MIGHERRSTHLSRLEVLVGHLKCLSHHNLLQTRGRDVAATSGMGGLGALALIDHDPRSVHSRVRDHVRIDGATLRHHVTLELRLDDEMARRGAADGVVVLVALERAP